MGMDIGIYIQRRTNNGWEDISLYQTGNKRVVIWYRGYDIAEYFRECGSMHIDIKDLRELALKENWIEEKNDDLPTWHVMTYTKIKYLANLQEVYDTENEILQDAHEAEFWRNLKDEIYMYLNFADYDFINSDDIRIIAFESY